MEVKETIELAKGINEYGMLAVTGALFLILSSSVMLFFIRSSGKIVNSVLSEYKQAMEDLLTETRKQNIYLSDIGDGLADETLSKIKVLSGLAFDLSVEKVIRIIRKVKNENNIADKEATLTKIKGLVKNLHDNRNSKFDNYSYKGKKLSEYTCDEWVDEVAEVIRKEVYNEKENSGRAYTNVKMTYDEIKLDFYKQLRKG